MTTHSKLSKGTLLTLTPFYMIGQGLVLGLLAGLLFGTYIVPLIGSLYGAGIGAVAGVVTGGILGIIYIILLGLMGIEGVLRSRIWLVPLSSLPIGIVFVLMMVEIFPMTGYITDLAVELLWFSPAAMAAIANAYGVDNWLEWLRQSSPNKLKVRRLFNSSYLPFADIFGFLVETTLRKIKWLLYLAPVGALIVPAIHSLSFPLGPSEFINWVFGLSVVAFVYPVFQSLLVALTVTVIIIVANRYFFTAETAPHIYKPNLSILTFLLVLPTQLVVALGIGAPIAAFIATLAVRDYADWVHSPEKQKVKPKVPPTTANDILKEALKQ